MSKQITIKNNQNKEEQVELICYFKKDNSKNYLFYTKNEILKDGLLKLYVADENNGMTLGITPEEWNELKGVMQDIISGNIKNNIKFQGVNGTITINDIKEILLNPEYSTKMLEKYENSEEVINFNNANSNKNLIANAFGGSSNTSQVQDNKEESLSIPSLQNLSNESTKPNIQISPIPTNKDDLSKEPVSMNMTSTEQIPTGLESLDSLTNDINNINLSNSGVKTSPIEQNLVPPVTDLPSLDNSSPISPSNNVKSEPEIKDFGVGTEPRTNIFDNLTPTPEFGISQAEINNNNLNTELSVSNNNINNNKIEAVGQFLEQNAKNDNELSQILEQLSSFYNASAKNKIEAAEIDKNIAELVSKVIKKVDTPQKETIINDNSGATLLNNDNTLNEQALNQMPDNIIPLQGNNTNENIFKSIA